MLTKHEPLVQVYKLNWIWAIVFFNAGNKLAANIRSDTVRLSCVSSLQVNILESFVFKVTVKPSKEKNTRLARVYVKGTSVHVEVSNSW